MCSGVLRCSRARCHRLPLCRLLPLSLIRVEDGPQQDLHALEQAERGLRALEQGVIALVVSEPIAQVAQAVDAPAVAGPEGVAEQQIPVVGIHQQLQQQSGIQGGAFPAIGRAEHHSPHFRVLMPGAAEPARQGAGHERAQTIAGGIKGSAQRRLVNRARSHLIPPRPPHCKEVCPQSSAASDQGEAPEQPTEAVTVASSHSCSSR